MTDGKKLMAWTVAGVVTLVIHNKLMTKYNKSCREFAQSLIRDRKRNEANRKEGV